MNKKYQEIQRRYTEHVIKLTEQFNELPPEEWKRIEPHLPVIFDAGDNLVAQMEASDESNATNEEWLRRAQAFAINTHYYLFMRRYVRRDKWLEMGLVINRRLQEQQAKRYF